MQFVCKLQTMLDTLVWWALALKDFPQTLSSEFYATLEKLLNAYSFHLIYKNKECLYTSIFLCKY